MMYAIAPTFANQAKIGAGRSGFTKRQKPSIKIFVRYWISMMFSQGSQVEVSPPTDPVRGESDNAGDNTRESLPEM